MSNKILSHDELLVIDSELTTLEKAPRPEPAATFTRPPEFWKKALAGRGLKGNLNKTIPRAPQPRLALTPGGEPVVLSARDNYFVDDALVWMEFSATNSVHYGPYGGWGDEVEHGTVTLAPAKGAAQIQDESALWLSFGTIPPGVSLAIELFITTMWTEGDAPVDVMVGFPTISTFRLPSNTRTSVAIYIPSVTSRPPGAITLPVRASARVWCSRAVVRRVT